MTKYKSLEFVTRVERAVKEAGDHYLTGAHVDDGFTIRRDGDYYFVGLPKEWGPLEIELHASRVNGAIGEATSSKAK